jgi:signal peptidase
MVRPIDNYVVGDIVTFKRPTDIEATTHRIYSDSIIDGELAYTTQGDANNTPDLLTVMKSDIIGKVWFSVPYLGYLLDFIRRPLGFVLLVGLPALWVFIEQVNKIVTETKRVKKKTDPDITTTI